MNTIEINYLENLFLAQKESSLHGKWITYNDIENLFSKYEAKFNVTQIGLSEEKRPIMQLKIGNGAKKILFWSQMHGNESTGTKGLFDFFNCIEGVSDTIFKKILKECTLDEMLDAIQKVHENVEYSNACMKDTLIHNLAENRKNSFKMGLLKYLGLNRFLLISLPNFKKNKIKPIQSCFILAC